MGFVGWFEVLPRLRTFRPLFCCGPKLSVEEGLKACAWRLTVFTFLRILLLATWGIATIPSWQNEHVQRRLPGLWLEFVVLTALVTIAVTMILVTWQLSVRYLYGCIVALPILFLFDFSVKATCYEVLFMSPTASAFGVVSLIEFWIRYAALTQTWLLLVTYIKEISPDETGIYMAGGANSRNSQIVRRNNSSIWEKPRLHPKRVTSSVPPNLPHISERSESYKSHIEYDRSPRQSQRQSQSKSRRSGNFSGRSPRNSRSTANRHSHRHSTHSGQFESDHELRHHDRDQHHNRDHRDHHDHRDSRRQSQRTDRRSIHNDDPYGFDDPESHRDSLQGRIFVHQR